MYNIAWYARSGVLNFFPKIANKMENLDIEFSSYYVCHNSIEEQYLRLNYANSRVWVLSKFLRELPKKVDNIEEIIRNYESKYIHIPLVRSLWSDMFELNLSEEERVQNFIGHINFWESFLIENKINMLVSEGPSVLSTCIAWMVCKKFNIKFCSFLPMLQLDSRMVTSSSWKSHYDGLQEKLNSQKINKNTVIYRNAIEYVKNAKTQPTKVQIVIQNKEIYEKITLIPHDLINVISKNLNIRKSWYKLFQKKQYYIEGTYSLLPRLFNGTKFYFRSLYLKYASLFDKNICPEDERFFIFPLHIVREWMNHSCFGLRYSNQINLIHMVSSCLPLGCKLYVKEHPSTLGKRPLSHYKAIKQMRNVRLIHPFEDTFNLIRHSQGIVTLGSSMGFEAIMMDKPVIVLENPWYYKLPGVYLAENPEMLAELLQNVRKLAVATEKEKIKIIYALYELSFKGFGWWDKRALDDENITEFAYIIQQRIKN